MVLCQALEFHTALFLTAERTPRHAKAAKPQGKLLEPAERAVIAIATENRRVAGLTPIVLTSNGITGTFSRRRRSIHRMEFHLINIHYTPGF